MNPFFKNPMVLGELRQGPLAHYLDIFASQLSAEGYGGEAGRRQLRLIGEFSWWLKKNRIQVEQISEIQTEKFLSYVRRKRPLKSTDPAAMKRLLSILLQERVIPVEPMTTEPNSAERVASEFGEYLLKERGLTRSTVFHYGQFVNRFLTARFGDGRVALSELAQRDVVDFVRTQSKSLGHKRAKLMTSALRSFLRFAHYKGALESELAPAVPRVIGWSLSDVPKALPVKHVAQILEVCDRGNPRGRRDFAIVLLLSRLGLRAGEVAALTLDDIDWQEGSISICGKGGQTSKLPLPTDVGEAISEYIRNGRPQTISRSLFFTVKAPIVPLQRQETVGHIVARLLTRAGIDTPRKGAHQLRHTLATEMLQQGLSLEEVGELLRHHSAQSTMIYAKVDLLSLKKLALSWPGGVQ
jgi:site-specific recombinase XerD